MYSCKSGIHRTGSLRTYVRHYATHSNEANVKFPCTFHECKRFFLTYTGLKSHVTRDYHHLNHLNRQKALVNLADTVSIGSSAPSLFKT